jgi:hypothetical protein
MYLELGQDSGDVHADSLAADERLLGNLLTRSALNQQTY